MLELRPIAKSLPAHRQIWTRSRPHLNSTTNGARIMKMRRNPPHLQRMSILAIPISLQCIRLNSRPHWRQILQPRLRGSQNHYRLIPKSSSKRGSSLSYDGGISSTPFYFIKSGSSSKASARFTGSSNVGGSTSKWVLSFSRAQNQHEAGQVAQEGITRLVGQIP